MASSVGAEVKLGDKRACEPIVRRFQDMAVAYGFTLRSATGNSRRTPLRKHSSPRTVSYPPCATRRPSRVGFVGL